MRILFAVFIVALSLFPVTESRAFGLAARAQFYEGRTARELGLPPRQWCADFMNMILGGGTHSRLARSYARYGTRTKYGCVDCIAVLTRRGGAHVGVVSGYDSKGNPIIISGNHFGRVGTGVYPRSRVTAWVKP